MKMSFAEIILSMFDKRETLAALDQCSESDFYDYSKNKQDEFWFDYLADTGSGWNSTTSMAWLIGREGIKLKKNGEATEQKIPKDSRTETMPDGEDGSYVLPAGDILILGGDEVYPSASAKAYEQRLINPFRCARYCAKALRHIYAVPGNHDWYDGLTAFIRVFCQRGDGRRYFGAWQTQQRRSYFAIKLPHKWWIWGVDIALENDLDAPQCEYFREKAKLLKEGDRVILCVAAPTWIENATEQHPDDLASHRKASKLNLIMNLGAKNGSTYIPLLLSGDLHYYVRHETLNKSDKRHYIVCGGGGAFLKGTIQTPKKVSSPDGYVACQKAAYPSVKKSKSLRWGVWKFPYTNCIFTALLAAFQLVSLYLFVSAAHGSSARDESCTAFWAQCIVPFPQKAGYFFQGDHTRLYDAFYAAFAAVSPNFGLFIWLTILFIIFVSLAYYGKPKNKNCAAVIGVGAIHWFFQILAPVFYIYISAIFATWVAVILAPIILYLYCGFLFGLYLIASSHRSIGFHDQEVFSSQGIEDFKSWLRIKVSSDGVTVYPIGIEKVARRWKDVVNNRPLRDRKSDKKPVIIKIPKKIVQRIVDPAQPLQPHLIEEPININ